MRVLCIWLPNWPIQRLVAAGPEYRRQAVVLSEERRQGLCVAACSPLAQKHGVRLAMPIAEAISLLSSQGIHVDRYQPQEDYQQLLQLAEWCERFSPFVGLEEVDRQMNVPRPHPESLLLNVTNLQPLFGSESQLMEQVEKAFRGRDYVVRLTIADTVGVAWAVAHCSARLQSDSQAIVPSGQTLEALQDYPVEALRLSRQTVHLLRQLGVFKVQQLRRLSRSSLSARLGPQLLLRLDQAQGVAAELWDAHQPQQVWQAEQILEHPTGRQEVVERVLQTLLAQLAKQLRERQQGAVRLVCRLEGLHDRYFFEVGLFRPTAHEEHLVELIQVRLEQARLPEAIQRIAVTVSATARLQHRQTEMFGHLRRTAYSTELTHFVDRIANRLGQDSVSQPRLQAEAQPERSFRYDRLTFNVQGSQQRQRRAKREQTLQGPSRRGSPDEDQAGQRPLYFYDPPLSLQHIALWKQMPQQFRCSGRQYRTARCWGPERIETAWWRGEMVKRDYYRVQTTQGIMFWLFCCYRQKAWFVQGVFS